MLQQREPLLEHGLDLVRVRVWVRVRASVRVRARARASARVRVMPPCSRSASACYASRASSCTW